MAFSCCLCHELINSHILNSSNLSSNHSDKGQDNLFVVTKCGHLFHLEPCLGNWVSEFGAGACPECKVPLTIQTDLTQVISNSRSKYPKSLEPSEECVLYIQKLHAHQMDLTSKIERLNMENHEWSRKYDILLNDCTKLQDLCNQTYPDKLVGFNDKNPNSKDMTHQLNDSVDGTSIQFQNPTENEATCLNEMFEKFTITKRFSIIQDDKSFDYEKEIFNQVQNGDYVTESSIYNEVPDWNYSENGSHDPLSLLSKIDLRNIWGNNLSTPSSEATQLANSSSKNDYFESRNHEYEEISEPYNSNMESVNATDEQKYTTHVPMKFQKKTPYQGIKQVYGKYSCSNLKCNAKWGSLRSYANQAQLCKFCNSPTFPYVQAPLLPKHSVLNRYGQQQS